MTFKDIQAENSPIKYKALLEQAYLIYSNDFLTVPAFAKWFGCSEWQAQSIINEGRHWNQLSKVEAVTA